MAIKPEYVFDVCFELYQRIFSEQQGISILDATAPSAGHRGGWRPSNGAEAKDYAADFALAGTAALEDSAIASRLILFRLYYLGCADYEKARRFLGLSERAWEQWTEEIRQKVGRELMRRGLFPPRNYFGERTRPRTKKCR